jgi:hypothetical protein
VTAGPVTGADGASAAQAGSSEGVGTDPQPPVPGAETRRNWPELLRRLPGWLPVLAFYLAVAIFMWWHVWGGGHPATTMLCNCGDPASFAWFMEWPAYAISHGHSLFLEHSDQVPTGLNLLDNTSVLSLGVALAPVTWLFGPVASLNVALTLAPALSAISAYGCLRRGLGVWRPAAFVAGLAFGFSPFMLRNEAIAHLQVSFLALVPLIFLCSYELAVTQRGRWWRWGLLLGLLATVQFFIGSEVLTMVALTVAGSLLAGLAAAAIFRRGTLAARLPFALRGLGLAGLLGAGLLAYPVWFAMAGPAHITGSDWARVTVNGLQRIIEPLPPSYAYISHLPDSGYLGPAGLTNGYLGVAAMLIVIAAALVVRHPLTWLCAAILIIATWASLGTYGTLTSFGGMLSWLPSLWNAVQNVPVLNQATPQNFSAIMVWVVVVAAAVLLDWVWAQRSAAALRELPARISGTAVAAVGGAVIAFALLVPWLTAWQLPLTVESVATPAPVQRILATLPPHAVVLFYPFPSSKLDQALIWQAADGLRFTIGGGRGITAGPGGAAVHGFEASTPAGLLTGLSTSYQPYGYLKLPRPPTPAVVATMRAAMRTWGVTNIIMSGGGRAPAYSRRWLTTVLGTPPQRQDDRWVWTDVQALLAS